LLRSYILVLDLGTTGIKACLMNREGRIVARGYRKVPQLYPKPGWVEQDPMQLWQLTLAGIDEAFRQVACGWGDVDAVGITNQRETTILWDKTTGEPVYNAIVWQCRRTADACQALAQNEALAEDIHARTGLVLDAYFSASKIQWLFQNVPAVGELAQAGNLLFGTVDTWILWKLTGQAVHATDYTNASRTMLLNIQTKTWDDMLLQTFGVPLEILPVVKKSNTHYGQVDPALTGGVDVSITALVGDQQSALYGQQCWEPGSCKNTFGTGAFLMMNLGERFLLSDKGLLTTLACDAQGNPCYAYEGAIFIAGAALEWLKDSLGIIGSFDEADNLAQSLNSNDGVYFVPAFVGLGAPYWQPNARGVITGLTQGTGKAHMARAALEAMAYQTADMVRLMQAESGLAIDTLKVDGGVSQSDFLMQFLSDMIQNAVCRMSDPDLTAKGAGYLAGLASGFWGSVAEVQACPEGQQVFHSRMRLVDREGYQAGWEKAVGQAVSN